MPTSSRPPRRRHERPPIDERIGQYLVNHPLLREVRERPEIVAPWIVLGLAGALAGLIAGGQGVVLVVGGGFALIRLIHAFARPSDRMDGLRLALILCWIAAIVGVIAIITVLEGATGYTGIILVVGLIVTLPVAGIALLRIFRV